MKKLSVIVFLLIFLAFTSFAQRTYSIQNLEKVSQLGLETYLKKSQKKKMTGAILSLTGPILGITGHLIDRNRNNKENMIGLGGVIGGIGVYTTLVGIPFFIVGSSRVSKIKKIQNAKATAINGVIIELSPCNFHNYMAQNCQHGVTLRIKF